MKSLLIYNLFSVACIIGAIVLAIYDKEGWGWLVLAGLLCHCSPTSK